MWEDINKAPYKEIFNPSVPGLHVWRCVQIQRIIDKALTKRSSQPANQKDLAVRTHGNRIIAALVFEQLPVKEFKNPSFDFNTAIDETHISSMVTSTLNSLTRQTEKHYTNSIIPTLFKNLSKCEDLAKRTRSDLKSRNNAKQ